MLSDLDHFRSIFRTVTQRELSSGVDPVSNLPLSIGTFKISSEANWVSPLARNAIKQATNAENRIGGLSFRLQCLGDKGTTIVNKIPEYGQWKKKARFTIYPNQTTGLFDDNDVEALISGNILAMPQMPQDEYDNQLRKYKSNKAGRKTVAKELLVRLCYCIKGDDVNIPDDFEIVQDNYPDYGHLTLYPKINHQPAASLCHFDLRENACVESLCRMNYTLHCMLLDARGHPPEFEECFDPKGWKLAGIINDCICCMSNEHYLKADTLLDVLENSDFKIEVITSNVKLLSNLVAVMRGISVAIDSDDYEFYFELLTEFENIAIDYKYEI